MKKIAFIDHSFKKVSRSSGFLLEHLKENYEVEVFWDESWNNGPRVDLRLISEGKFDVLILFQQISYYSISELNSVPCTIVLIPMYDADGDKPDIFWYQYRNFKFVNFSKTTHQRLLDIGIDSFCCQYFPPPPPPDLFSANRQNYSQLKGFFWQRRYEITWNEIKKLLGQGSFSKIHIHTAVDPPGFDLVLPTEEERSRYQVTTSNWFSTKEQYLKTVADCQVFFAPRLYEGIGMAFLEAMAMGKCVVAPNNPTMNEYITHGLNGLLYDPADPQPLDFSNIEAICANARKYMSEGFARWPENLRQMTAFIAEPKKRKFFPLPVLKKRLRLYRESKKQEKSNRS